MVDGIGRRLDMTCITGACDGKFNPLARHGRIDEMPCCRALKLQLGAVRAPSLPGLVARTPTFHASGSPVSSTHVHPRPPAQNIHRICRSSSCARRKSLLLIYPHLSSVPIHFFPHSISIQLPRTTNFFRPHFVSNPQPTTHACAATMPSKELHYLPFSSASNLLSSSLS